MRKEEPPLRLQRPSQHEALPQRGATLRPKGPLPRHVGMLRPKGPLPRHVGMLRPKGPLPREPAVRVAEALLLYHKPSMAFRSGKDPLAESQRSI